MQYPPTSRRHEIFVALLSLAGLLCWVMTDESDISERQTTINIQLLGLHFIQFLVNFKLNFLSVFV